MITKVTDTDAFINFEQTDVTNLEDYQKYKYEIDEILDIEDAENQFTLALFIISIFIFFIYLILLLCFFYENVCFANYNPKCKQPYYFLMMILNFIACFANSMISFIFFSYRISSIDTYTDYPYFIDTDFKDKNDLNIALDIISAFCYLFCLIFHLITCYYLFKEDGICYGCCSEFLNCISCCTACLKCFFCCCCCCCNCEPRTAQRRPSFQPKQNARGTVVAVFPQNIQNIVPVIPYNAQQGNPMYLPNQMYQESSQFRNYLGEDLKIKIESVCKSDIYSENYRQFAKCSICKINFNNNEDISILPCGHVFHKNCVYNWFFNNKTCPEDGMPVLN